MFAPYCYPPAGSEAIVTSKLVIAMLAAGWEVDVICQQGLGLYYPYSEDGAWEPVKRVAKSISSLGAGSAGPTSILLGRLRGLLWTRKALAVAKELLRTKEYDCVVSRATPLYGHLPALILSGKTTLPWIACWSDPLPPQKAPPPYGKGARASLPFHLKRFCASVAKEASWHVFPCERLRRYVSLYMAEISGKSSVIPHVMLTGSSEAAPSAAGEFSLCHVGSLANRNPQNLLLAIEAFIDGSSKAAAVSVRFVGPTDDELTKQLAGRERLRKVVTVEQPRTYEEVQALMARSTVLVVLEAPCEEGIFFPSKFVEYVETGRPVLAVSPRQGTMADLVGEHGGGLAADCSSAASIGKALAVFWDAWHDGTLDSRFGSSKLRSRFSGGKVLTEYGDLVGGLTGRVQGKGL